MLLFRSQCRPQKFPALKLFSRFSDSASAVLAADPSAERVPASPTNTSPNSNTTAKNNRQKRPEKVKIPSQNINNAFDIVKKNVWARFDETVEAIVCLAVDPRKPNQSIKGVAQLPNGNGKKVVVAVFAKDADQKAARDAGADIVGAEDLILKIQSGDISFQRAIATPDMMPALSKIGKVKNRLFIYILKVDFCFYFVMIILSIILF